MKKLCIALLLWPLSLLAQDGEFSFSDDPSSVLGSAKLTLPSKSGSVLSLDGSSSFDNNEGAVTYSYKIPLPPWRGLLSSLDIAYGSSQGVQNCGQGFALAVPYVERVTAKGVPDNSSRLNSSRDGELVAVGGKHLRAKREKSYRLYRQEGDTILAYEGDGRIYVYGLDAGAQERTGDFIARWWLSEIRDPAGSKVSFVYRKFEGQGSYLDKVLFVDGTQSGTVSVSYGFEVVYKEFPYRHSSWRSGVDKVDSHFVSTVAGYWIGGQLSESAAASQSLAGARGDSRVFQVNLEYQTSAADQRPLLSRVVYHGRSDTAADAKPATNFFYSASCPGPNCATTMAVNREYVVPGTSIFTQASTLWIDMNGDGLADVVSRDDELNWSVLINKSFDATDNAIVFAEPIKTRFPFRDFDSPQTAVIDVNGDRRADLLVQDPLEGTVSAFVNELSPDGFWSKQATPVPGLPPQASVGNRMQGTWIDINADGKTDFVSYVDGDEVELHVFLNKSGSRELRFEYAGELKMANRLRVTPSLITWADVNADGLPDLLRFISSDEGAQQLVVYLNNGRLGVQAPYVLSLNGYTGLAIPRFVDVNGDGLPDAVTGSESIPLSVYLNNGTNAWARFPGGIDASAMGQVVGFDVGDINGNGSADLLISTVGRKVFVYDPYFGQPTKAPHLLERVAVETGLEERFSYQSSAKGDSPRTDSMPVTMQVLRRYEVSAATFGVNGQYSTQLTKARDFEVKLPSYNFEDNEFSGFKQLTTIDYQDLPVPAVARGQRTVSTYYTSENGFYLKGLLKLRETYTLSKGVLFTKEANEYGARPLFKDTDIRAVFQKSQEKWEYEGDKFQKISTSYCTEMKYPEMVPAKRTVSTFMNDAPVQTIVSMMHIDAGMWFVSRPERLVLIDPREKGPGQTLIDKKFEYNAAICRLSKIQDLTESGSYLTKAEVIYDELGNPKELIDGRAFRTQMFYEDPGQFTVTKHVQAVTSDYVLEQTASYDYLAGAQITSLVDANGNKAEFSYDGQGRISTWRSAENETPNPDFRFEYLWGTATRPTQVKSFSSTMTRPKVSVFDATLAEAAEFTPARGGYHLDKFLVRDGLGNVITSSRRLSVADYEVLPIPIGPMNLVLQDYDERSRLTRTEEPAPQNKRLTTSLQYSLQDGLTLTTTSNSAGFVQRVWKDALERIAKTSLGEKPGVDRAFTYDAAHRIREITGADPAVRSYEWGLNGKLKAVRSATFGAFEFDYDANDNVQARRVIDSKGVAVESRFYVYDGKNRVLEERLLRGMLANAEEGLEQAVVDFRYTYDRPSVPDNTQRNLAGKMASLQVFPGATYHYSYDRNGNKIGESLAFYDQTYQMNYQYDALGRIQNLEYPDKSAYVLNYDPDDGLLNSIKDVITRVEYNGYNDAVTIQTAQFEQASSFDENTGAVLSRSLTGPSLNVSLAYDGYDAMSRVTSISGQDAYFGKISRGFTYDAAGRLETAKIQYLEPKGVGPIQEKLSTYSYDSYGRLLTTEFGGLSYGESSQGRSIRSADAIWNFDAAGRLSEAPGGRQIHWWSVERPACFVGGSKPGFRIESLPDGSRFTEVRNEGGQTKSRLYFNKYAQWDQERKQWTKFFYVDREPIVVMTGNESWFVFRDELGTAELEVGSAGGAHSAIHYPFGGLMWESEKADWRGNFRFAGSIGVSGFEFYQMTTRFYDPRIGQFISPDMRYVMQPKDCLKSPIECDIYSYARNNPEQYIDPSGEAALQVVAAIIGGATSGAVTYFDKAADGNISSKDIAVIAVSTLSGALKGATYATFGPSAAAVIIGSHINLAEQALSVAIENGGKKMDPANAGLNVVAKVGVATALDMASFGLGKGLDKMGASLGETMKQAVSNTERIFVGGGSEAAAGAAGAQFGVKAGADIDKIFPVSGIAPTSNGPGGK